jgi:hypothetical protein
MAQKTEKSFRSFIKGLITEANELTFPESASVDEQNFVLNRDGSRSRRLGVDFEESYLLTSSGLTTADLRDGKQSFHVWESPAGDTAVSLGIIRIKNKLWFIDLLSATPSANFKNSGSAITISGLSNSKLETAVINNSCILVSEDLSKPVLLSYNKSTGAVTQSTIDIKIRDIYGVDDGLTIDNRPSSIANLHKYNLRNQGWNSKIVSISGADAIDQTKSAIGVYPSNADYWILGKNGNPTSADYEKYDGNILQKNSTSNYPVAKGSYIIDAFNRGTDRITKSGVTGLPTDKENGSITTVASYAQRLFYSGIQSDVTGSDDKSPNYSGYIFFSNVVRNNDDLGACYMEADPTDANVNDIIDSDGGTIQLPEVTRVVKLASSQASLLVFCENGVWEIYGDTGGFIATSFQASKISTNGITNPDGVVEIGGNFVYWSKAGIYALYPDSASGRFLAESISLKTIQKLYLDIPSTGKNNCKGFYDEKENQVRWLYNDNANYSTTNYINKYNKELIYDLTLQAWYKNTISELASNSPYVADYVPIPGYSVTSTEETVYKGTDEVLVTAGDSVVIDSDLAINRSSQFSYLTIRGTSFTLSKYKDDTFKDWVSSDATGISYSSYLVTGWELFGDFLRKKQVPYIQFYFKRTENGYTSAGGTLELTKQSSCKVQSQWNWTDSANSGKWGSEFQAYRLLRNYLPSGPSDPFDYGEGIIITKNKLRGSGKTLSLKIQSEAGKDMQLLGWGLPVTLNDNI